MSIIQAIREKGAVLVISLVAISLIGFILMDSISSTGKLFGGGNETTIGIVNGDAIDYQEFNEKVTEMEQQYGNQSGQRNMVMQGAWDQMVSERIVNDQFDKLGLVFTAKELSSVLFSEEAPLQLKQAFTDPNTGQYDIEQAKQWWSQVKQNKNKEQRSALISQVIDPMVLNSLYSKYTALIAGSINEPSWMINMEKASATDFAVISYVSVPYSTIADSTVKISTQDVKDYLNARKSMFKQENGTMISYVSFSAAPSKEDSLAVFNALEELKPEFRADTNAKFFLGRNGSTIPFFDGYLPGSQIQAPIGEPVSSLVKGEVYGPYLDGKNYVLAKVIDIKNMPDSFKVRHILFGTIDPQTQQPIMDDSTARRKADSVATAIKNGASFDALEPIYSTDQGAKQTQGVMNFDLKTVQSDNFAKEFGKFLLNDAGETKKVVKTEFGYHYIEIMSKSHYEPSYKIAYMARQIDPSDETINKANAEAVKLSAAATSPKALEEYLVQNGISKVDLPLPVGENDYQLGSYANAREIVRWANEAKEGAVSEPFSIDDDFVVAIVNRRLREGLMDVQTALPYVESDIRNQKKAEVIKKKMTNTSSLEAVAKDFNVQVMTAGEDSTLTFNSQIISGIGNEPKVTGAAFAKDAENKVSAPISGNNGVFVIKVDSYGKKPVDDALWQEQVAADRNRELQTALQQSFMGLRKMAKIKDYRSKFF
ncbi:MAG: SurA N-terminal domain-containing protein [Chitinophagaceae bacterium]|nr:SurA N-terminal domain-containing protein [Chitinophagaceae bacterium]